MKKALVKFGWPIIIAAVIVGLYVYGKTRPVKVETAVAFRGPIEEYVTEEAKTQLHTERIVTAESAGTAARIVLEEGDAVKAGQNLTTVEDTDFQLSLDAMRAGVKEIEARLAGADVPLPKESEIEAAEEEHRRAGQQVEVLTQEKKAAEADREYAEKDFKRVAGLFESGSASDRQHDLAQRNLKAATATLEAVNQRLSAAQTAVKIAALRKQVLLDSMQDTAHLHQVYAAQREQAQKMMDQMSHQIAKTGVSSPIDGIILEKYLDSEQHVQPGTPLLKVGELASIEIRADILSDEIGRVKVGQEVRLIGKAIRTSGARGRVKKIYPSGFTKVSSLGVRQQRVAVLVEFDNSELNLQPGYELDVKIAVAAKDGAVLVPGEAVIATGDGAAVFVVENGRARLRTVSTGLKGDRHYEITSGLAPDEVVILRPPTDLEDGKRVRASLAR